MVAVDEAFYPKGLEEDLLLSKSSQILSEEDAFAPLFDNGANGANLLLVPVLFFDVLLLPNPILLSFLFSPKNPPLVKNVAPED